MIEDPRRLPLRNIDDAGALIAAVDALARDSGTALRPPPPLPMSCCGRGCSGCVWQGYFAALVYWRDQAVAALDLVARPVTDEQRLS